jgi:hypothetical protein
MKVKSRYASNNKELTMTKHPLILATTNPTKIEKLESIFAPYFDEIQPQDLTLDVQEEGEPLVDQDAAMKAVAASLRYNCPAVATVTADQKELVAIANKGKLLFAEEVDGGEKTWDQLKQMVDWFLQAR